MFRWQGGADESISDQYAEDQTLGASIARIVAKFPPFPSEKRRKKLKGLAALKCLRDFGQLEIAMRSITSRIDSLAPRVLQREGWRHADAVAFATDGSLPPLSRDSSAESHLERRELLVGILSLDTIGNFGSAGESYAKLREELACHSLALVASVARRYAAGNFLQYADLFQSGIEGLYTAIERYDPFLGYEFSTFATPWIRQVITRTIANEQRLIRIPIHALETLERIEASRVLFCLREEREPSITELAEEVHLTVKQVVDLTRQTQLPIRISEDFLLESLRDFSDEIQQVEASIVSESITEILERFLNRRERLVIEYRFGLGVFNPQTLQEIGEMFGVTRERIRQIEMKAIRKLRGRATKTLLALR